MITFDFDRGTQAIINKHYAVEAPIAWKDWLKINSKEEYIEACLRNSGLSDIDKLSERLKKARTDSRELSVDKEQYLASTNSREPYIFCHTSGTTNNDPSALKWFHISKTLIERLWAPGMRAIFESSGLDSRGSAVIFVPSRMLFDGINEYLGKSYISLYSSELSQRIVISLIKPKSYVLYPYKDVYNLKVLDFILNMPRISVISAPAATLLKWADITRLKSGINQFIANQNKQNASILKENQLFKFIEKEGIEKGVPLIQKRLSEKISQANVIFSISSLDEERWNLIRSFMKWEKGKERFTNLYVGSEIGPFASSLPLEGYEISRTNKMYVFPLTVPVIQYKNEMDLITEFEHSEGRLLISRAHNGTPLVNIDTGDIISIKGHNSLPLIGGDIYRGEFTLNYEIYINQKIKTPSNYSISAGNYFTFQEFEIKDAYGLLDHLKQQCSLNSDSLVLNSWNKKKWQLYLPVSNGKCSSSEAVEEIVLNNLNEATLSHALKNQMIDIVPLTEPLVDFISPRDEVLQKVREGKSPKGILKKWPLYVIKPKH
ncbi:MAG: hypothetical protein BAJALOKI1v1_1480002 [Promethearchaeota archaeon]|nr:MAG: hypothetical protein BAJALOKI1v1_1480002 [Candidatus Lokiarchaeota archaeon]